MGVFCPPLYGKNKKFYENEIDKTNKKIAKLESYKKDLEKSLAKENETK